MAQLLPLGDHVVVSAIQPEKTSMAGIILPDQKEERPQQGKVLAVGPGKLQDDGSHGPMHVAVGDTVLFKKYSPDEFELAGEKVLVISQSDILAKLQ